MPDLGAYAVEVVSAYVASLVLIVVLVLASLRRSVRVRDQLREVEERGGRRRDG